MRHLVSTARPSWLHILWRLVLLCCGMLIYALINGLLFLGFLITMVGHTGWATRTPSLAEDIATFLLAGGGGALLLAPLAYALLRWWGGRGEQPKWRQTLLPLWLGYVTYTGLHLPLFFSINLLPWHVGYEWQIALLVTAELVILTLVCLFRLQWRWFSAGLLLAHAHALLFGGDLWNLGGHGQQFFGGYSYVAVVFILSIAILIRAIVEAQHEAARGGSHVERSG